MEKRQWQQKGAGHRQRLRERFLASGLDAFSAAEVLELLLSFGTPRKDCKEPARELLKAFKSFAAVLDATPHELSRVAGVGEKNSFALQFVKAVADRYLQERLHGKSYLKSSHDVINYLRHSLQGRRIECFTAIFLDASLGIIDAEVIAEGTITVNTVYPREIMQRAITRHAAALLVAHNHPSGSLTPSAPDISLTRQLYLLCTMMQIRLLDHIIIGDGYFSFADNGIMAEISDWAAAITSGFAVSGEP
jgi:DNA repair protein RadC